MSLPSTTLLRRIAPLTTPRFTSVCPSALVTVTRRAYYHNRTSSFASSVSAKTARPVASGALSKFEPPRRTMATNGNVTSPEGLRLNSPVVFVCDMQDKFREAIHEFDKIVLTIEKLLTFAQKLPIPIYATTQNAARLGATVPSLSSFLPATPWDKTRFSMVDEQGSTPGFSLPPASSVALVGIESHICITQTALDLRSMGHTVYIIADAVSSCNRAEVVVALDRLRAEEGIRVTTSESWMYEVVGDAKHPSFKSLFNVVKGSMANTKQVLEALPPGSKI